MTENLLSDAESHVSGMQVPSRPIVFGVFLSVAIITALVSYAISVRFDRTYKIPVELSLIDGMSMTPEQTEQLAAENANARLRNTVLCFALAGPVIVGAFGLASGLLAKSWSSALKGLGLGVFLGAVLGAAGGWVNATTFNQLSLNRSIDPTLRTICAHALGWLFLGGATAMTAWVASPRKALSQFCVATAGAAVLSGLFFSPSATFLFPISRPEDMFPEGSRIRIYFFALSTVLFGLSLGIVWTSTKGMQSAGEG